MKNVICVVILLFLLLSLNIFSQDSADRLFLIGKRLQNEKNYSDAIIIYNKIIETAGIQNRLWTAAAYFELGNIYYELENYQAAHESFSNLLKYYPSHYLVPNSRNMLEKIQSKTIDETDASSSEEKILTPTPPLPVSETYEPATAPVIFPSKQKSNLAADLKIDNNSDTPESELSKHYQQILKDLTDSSLYDAIIKGNKLFETGEYEKAYNLYSDLLKENKDNYLVAYNYALTLIKLERYEEAANILDNIFEKYSNDIDVILNLAHVYQKQNKLLLSKMLWRAALRIEPENKIAEHNLKILNERFGL
jgi:tetratricopeptide (TPR) repeat protein